MAERERGVMPKGGRPKFVCRDVMSKSSSFSLFLPDKCAQLLVFSIFPSANHLVQAIVEASLPYCSVLFQKHKDGQCALTELNQAYKLDRLILVLYLFIEFVQRTKIEMADLIVLQALERRLLVPQTAVSLQNLSKWTGCNYFLFIFLYI
jgi:hypothetical protein